MTIADDKTDTSKEKFEVTTKGSWQKRSVSISRNAPESKVRAYSSYFVNSNKSPQSTHYPLDLEHGLGGDLLLSSKYSTHPNAILRQQCIPYYTTSSIPTHSTIPCDLVQLSRRHNLPIISHNPFQLQPLEHTCDLVLCPLTGKPIACLLPL
jgi:hypothetical protein